MPTGAIPHKRTVRALRIAAGAAGATTGVAL